MDMSMNMKAMAIGRMGIENEITKNTPVSMALETLMEQVEQTDHLVSSLAQRLIPVRSPRDIAPRDSAPRDSAPSFPTDEPAIRQPSSTVVSSIHSTVARISHINNDIRVVLDDLEV